MRIKTLSCWPLVYYVLLSPLFLWGSIFSIILIIEKSVAIKSLWLIFLGISGHLIISIFIHRNAFTKIIIDKEGIHNKHLSFKWNEIDETPLKEYDVKIFEYRLPRPKHIASIVSLGDTNAKKFEELSKNENIFFSMNKKTATALVQFGAGKSQTINYLLNWYNNYPKIN